jgi:DNA-binding HxlR family transcriptional regulator
LDGSKERTLLFVTITDDRDAGARRMKIVKLEATESPQPMPPRMDEVDHAECRAIVQVLDRIGDKWTVMVVGTLAPGPIRFNAILRRISGLSHRMLTLTLRGLQRDGLVQRRAYPTIPPKVEYELTPMGRSLIEPLHVMWQWAQLHRPTIDAARAEFDAAPADEKESEA